MADRISALESEKVALESHISSSTKPKKPPSTAEPASNDPAVAQIRLDLAEALRSKGVTETRLRAAQEELDQLRTKTKGDSRSIRGLETDRTALTTRVKDREHELREKRKLLEVGGLPILASGLSG